jgi:glycerophosphoryl diester phosphodiesterase
LASRILLFGHRGARLDAPENTFAAFDLALRHGVDGFEFDVRRTRDARLIICHGPKFHRRVIRRQTLKQLRAAALSPKHMPPTLEGVLERYGRSAFLNIEVKVRGAEELVARAVKTARPQQYFISSFLPGVIRRLHALDRSLVLGALAQTRWQLRRWRTLPVAYVVPHYRLLSRRLVEKVHAADRAVITWTVNERKQMLRAAELGVDGIISDDARLLNQTLGSTQWSRPSDLR